VEALQKKPIKPAWNKRPTNQHHYLENVTAALNAIEQDGVKLVNIGECHTPLEYSFYKQTSGVPLINLDVDNKRTSSIMIFVYRIVCYINKDFPSLIRRF